MRSARILERPRLSPSRPDQQVVCPVLVNIADVGRSGPVRLHRREPLRARSDLWTSPRARL
jgi:hypothetical protein